MKNKNWTNLFVGVSTFIGSILMSCSRVGLPVSAKIENQTKLPDKEQKYDVTNNQKDNQEYQIMYADSIRRAKGYDSNKTDVLWRKVAEIAAQADSLAMENSLGVVLQKEVENAGNKILKDFLNNVSGVLKTYKISLQDYLIEDNDFLWRFNTYVQEDNYDADYVLKQPLVYFGVNTQGFSDMSSNEFDEFMVVINQIIDESDYAKKYKKEIINKINLCIKKTKTKLVASRKSIERKYSDYYVVMDGQDPAFITYGPDDWNYGYSDTEYPDRQSVVKLTTLSVCGKNLPIKFFEDKKAKYELVNLGNSRWQVKKISNIGVVENTPIFTDKAEISVKEYYADFNAHDYSKFCFEPMHDSGARIETITGVVVKRAKSHWWPSRNIINKIDSLESEARKYSKQATELELKNKMINQYADSVARVMVNQRCK